MPRTNGRRTSASVSQQITAPNSATLIGEGKVEEALLAAPAWE